MNQKIGPEVQHGLEFSYTLPPKAKNTAQEHQITTTESLKGESLVTNLSETFELHFS